MLATFFEPRRPQDAPRRPQDGHKTPQDAPTTPQEAPRRSKTPQDAPKAPKTLHFGRFLGDFLEDFWKIFWKNLPSNLSPQPCIFDPNWRQVEIWTTMETTETENLGERRRLPKRKNRLLSPLRSLGPGKPGGAEHWWGNRVGCRVPALRGPRDGLLGAPGGPGTLPRRLQGDPRWGKTIRRGQEAVKIQPKTPQDGPKAMKLKQFGTKIAS